ncbi:MAG: translation elongation factor Ts [Candidatus Bipolaricaulia bacterium]
MTEQGKQKAQQTGQQTKIPIETIKQLRTETGIGYMDCKRALEQSDGDIEKAKELLRREGQELISGHAHVSEGRIDSYIHHNGKVGTLVEIDCETDFAANSDPFREFIRNIALHIASSAPQYISPEDIPEEELERERSIYREQAEQEEKPEHIIDRIVEGKLKRYYEQVCLLRQAYVKDPDIKVEELLSEIASQLGENVVIRRFVRFEVGR